MDCAVSAYINYLRIAGRANPALLAGSGDSDARHTDKLFSANRTKDQLAVGDVTNMYVIVEKMEQAGRVVRP